MDIKYIKNENGPVLGYTSVNIIEQDGLYFKDMDGTGVLKPYEDWRLDAEERAKDRIVLRIGKRTLENAQRIRHVYENGRNDNADDSLDTVSQAVKIPKHENERNVDQKDHKTGRQVKHNIERRRDRSRAADKDLSGDEKHIIRHTEEDTADEKIADIRQDLTQFFGIFLFFHKKIPPAAFTRQIILIFG
jgi:hypothetical protein